MKNYCIPISSSKDKKTYNGMAGLLTLFPQTMPSQIMAFSGKKNLCLH